LNTIISPSILSADFGILASEVESVLSGDVNWIHVDVMDGQFVPNLTMGPMIVRDLRRHFPTVHIDAHLMVWHPEQYIDAFVQSGADSISIHAESTPHVHRVLQQINANQKMAGLALNPATGLDILAQVMHDIDYLLIMTVNPGFGGQPFLQTMLDKIQRARNMLDASGLSHVSIQVDGGISQETAHAVVQAGASNLVAGSAIFAQDDRAMAIQAIQQAAGRR
jgi:ribulose-phosphate 3-epimerase